jgi:hypothetical protein
MKYAKRTRKKMKTPRDADARKQRRAAERRRALQDTLAAAHMTPSEAARAAGLPTPNSIFNFLKGRSFTLSQLTLEKLAEAIPGASLASLSGLEPIDTVPPPSARPVQVRSAAAAGLMQASFDLPLSQQKQVFMPVDNEMQTAGVFGVVVREPGAEKLFPAGSILVCVPIHSYEAQLQNGNKVILQRIVGTRVEVTVCELELQANEAWLWLRSTHPEHQNPVRMPFTIGQTPRAWRDGNTRFSVAAVVVGAYLPLVAP